MQIIRRRLVISAATVLVFAYAVVVTTYVMLIPDLGIRCTFSPVVNHFNPDFLYPTGSEPLQADDEIVQLGNQKVTNWSEFLHKLVQLRHEEGLPCTEAELREKPPGDQLIVN